MDRQFRNLGGVTKQQAIVAICDAFPTLTSTILDYELDYYAYPEIFSNTAGPFNKPGKISGQAFTQFTIEAWVVGKVAVLFCQGDVIKVVDDWAGVGSVRL